MDQNDAAMEDEDEDDDDYDLGQAINEIAAQNFSENATTVADEAMDAGCDDDDEEVA